MSFLAAGAIIYLLGAGYAVLLKRKLAETIILALVSIIFILYCFGLINTGGSLLYGIYTVVALAAASVAYAVYRRYKEKETFKNAQLLRGGLLFAGFLGLSAFISYGRFFHLWDEFSFWGIMVKHLFYEDALGTVTNPNYGIFAVWYIPGPALIQYFFTRFSGQFIEHNSFIAQNMMFFCLIMPLIKDIFSKKKWITQLLLLGILVLLPTVTDPMFYSTLYVDAMLGVFFGFSLLYYYKYRYEESPYGILLISASLSMLVLIKHMGFPLAIGVLAVILADMLFFRRSQVISMIGCTGGILKKAGKMLMLLLPFFCVFIFRFSWESHVAASGFVNDMSRIGINEIVGYITGRVEPFRLESRGHFLWAMRHTKVSHLGMSSVEFSIAFVLAALMLSFLLRRRPDSRRMMLASLLVTAGLYIYQFTLSLLIAFSFTEQEVLMIAGYDRYTGTYLLGMVIFLLVFYSKYYAFELPGLVRTSIVNGVIKLSSLRVSALRLKDCLRVVKGIVIAVISIGLLLYFFRITINTGRVALYMTQAEVLFTERPIAVSVRKWMPYFRENNPHIIAQRSLGYEYIVVLYELVPYASCSNTLNDWSINTEPFHPPPDDIWTLVVTPEEWEQHILSHDIRLIYVWYADDVLKNIYGRFFYGEVQSDMVYRVEVNDGRMLLIPVEQP
jgi:hypothetical protein